MRLYDNLFTDPEPDTGDKNFLDYINPDSLIVQTGCKAERFVEQATAASHYQFMRLGYFCADKDSTPAHLIFNRIVPLKDDFKKK